jgi:bacterioferritin
MGEGTFDKSKVVAILNRILETELAGVVRYTHYSFMVFGYSRIPIVSWLRSQATESMRHAQEAGELIAVALYRELLDLTADRSVLLEEYARRMVAEEEMHVGEVNKMLRG